MSIQNHIARFDALTKSLDEARAILACLQSDDNGENLSWETLATVLSGAESLIDMAAGEADIWLDEARHLEKKREGHK